MKPAPAGVDEAVALDIHPASRVAHVYGDEASIVAAGSNVIGSDDVEELHARYGDLPQLHP
jgi:hypothetical protein